MKGKILIYICLIFTLMGCDKHLTTDEVEDALRGNTFISVAKGIDLIHRVDF